MAKAKAKEKAEAKTREEISNELEALVGGEPGGGGMGLWSGDKGKADDVDPLLAALEEEYGPGGFDEEVEESITTYDENGFKVTPKGNKIPKNTGQKIAFRNLPPRITEAEFLDITGLDRSEFNYFFIQHPKLYRPMDFNARAMAHVNFVDYDMSEIYLEKFDNFVFIDKWGRDFVCSTSRSADQRIPQFKNQTDPLEGSVCGTEDFQHFKMLMEVGAPIFGVTPDFEDGVEMCDVMLKEIEEREKNPPKFATCPLVEFFKNKKVKEEKKLVREEEVTKAPAGPGRSAIRKNRPHRRNRNSTTHTLAVASSHDTFDALVLEAAREQEAARQKQSPSEVSTSTPSLPQNFEKSFPQLASGPGCPETEQQSELRPAQSWSSFHWQDNPNGNANANGDSYTADERLSETFPITAPSCSSRKSKSSRHVYSKEEFLVNQPSNPNPSKKLVEPDLDESFEYQEQKTKDDRRARREREHKEKRLKRINKLAEDLKAVNNKPLIESVPEFVVQVPQPLPPQPLLPIVEKEKDKPIAKKLIMGKVKVMKRPTANPSSSNEEAAARAVSAENRQPNSASVQINGNGEKPKPMSNPFAKPEPAKTEKVAKALMECEIKPKQGNLTSVRTNGEKPKHARKPEAAKFEKGTKPQPQPLLPEGQIKHKRGNSAANAKTNGEKPKQHSNSNSVAKPEALKGEKGTKALPALMESENRPKQNSKFGRTNGNDEKPKQSSNSASATKPEKIVKKIIVKRVKANKEAAVGGAEGENRPQQQSGRSNGENPKPKLSSNSNEKPEAAKIENGTKTQSATAAAAAGEPAVAVAPRTRNPKARPDMQIYRPGSFKKAAAAIEADLNRETPSAKK